MNCPKDKDCLALARRFSSAKAKINGNFSTFESDMEGVVTELDIINEKVPMETVAYLGTKVKESLDNIKKSFEEFNQSVVDENEKINSEIDNEIVIHNRHYQDWYINSLNDDINNLM